MPQENMEDFIGRRCFVCNRYITQKDYNEKNGPMRIAGIPGISHIKCKIRFDTHISQSGFNSENIQPLVEEIKNEK